MNHQKEFQTMGFTVIRNMINDTDDLYNYTLYNKVNGDFNDPQIPNTPSFYNDKKMTEIQLDLLPILEKNLNLELFKTYNYYRIYKRGDILKMHRDRPACEISVTINLGYKNKPWGIWITDFDENPHQVFLEPGDGLVYHGCDLWHWRGINNETDNCSQVFMQYVDQNGPCSWAKDDNSYD